MKIKIFVTEEKWQDDRMQMTHFSLYDFDARQSGDYIGLYGVRTQNYLQKVSFRKIKGTKHEQDKRPCFSSHALNKNYSQATS